MSLSRLLNLPHHDLDALAFVDERWTLRPAPERDAMLTRILERPSFVSEGGFLRWTEPLLVAADHVVWLDPPLWVLVWRHVRRHWRQPWRLPSQLRFQVLMYLRPAGAGPAQFDPDQTRSGTEIALRPFKSKVLRVTRSVAAADVIRKLGLSPLSAEPAPPVPAVQEQLVVFAREIGELFRLERSRNADLESVNSKLQGQLKTYIRMARRDDDRIEELKMAILCHLAADHDDGSADDLRDALKGKADD